MMRSSSDILRQKDPVRWKTMDGARRNQEVRTLDNLRNQASRYATYEDRSVGGYERGLRKALMEASPNEMLGGSRLGNYQDGVRMNELGLNPVINAAQDRNYELKSRERAMQNWGWEDEQRENERAASRWENEKRGWQRSMWDRVNKMTGGSGNVSAGGSYSVSGLR